MPRWAFAAVLIVAGCAGARQRAVPLIVCSPSVATAPDTTVYAAESVSQRPVRLSGPMPLYPQLMRENRVSASLVLRVVIDAGGHPDTASVRVQSARGLAVEFVPSATAAVLGSTFSPAIRCGRAVRVRVQVPFHFEVDTTSRANPYHLR